MNPTRTWTLAVALVLPLIGGGALAGDFGAGPAGRDPIAEPPAAYAPGDPADTLYQTARAALSRGDYRKAATLFRRIVDEEPGSAYAPDALYWQAFSLQRLGGDEQLREAAAALELQRERYPDAATLEDGESLLVRIRGQLAQRGDAESAEYVVSRASGTTYAREATREANRAVRDANRAVARANGREDPCENEETEIRVAALHALSEMDADRALPVLEKVLARRDECSEVLRERAIFIVADSDADRAGGILLNVARTDPDPEVRAKAVFWLSQVDDPRAVDALVEILENSGDPELQERALFALAEADDERTGRILRDYARNESKPTELRAKAIFWLSEDESPDNVDFLKELFGRLTDPELRERVLFSIAESDDPGTGEWLIGVARDASVPVELRGRALFWAAESDDEAVHPVLIDLWDRVDDPEIKRQLLFAYSEMDTPESLDMLYRIATSNEDVEVRKRALMWLGESDDPRVADLLEDFVTQ